ncbi:MAG: SGNH/GDSL hydrolase family protein [Candidatus Binatia bacterium]
MAGGRAVRTGRMWRALASVVLSLVVFLVSGEILARALGIVDRLNGYSRLMYAPGPSVDLPYVLRPGVETKLFDIPVRVNRFGFRGPDVSPAPEPGVRRIVVVGDSVVFGQGVREEETVSSALARRLATGGERWEAVNAGVPGYDAVSDARLLELVVAPLRPDVVVVGTSLNDYDVSPAYSPTGVLMRKELDERSPDLADRSEFLVLLRWARAWVRGELFSQVSERVAEQQAKARAEGTASATAANLGRLTRDLHLRFYRAPEPKYWNRLRGAYADIARLAATKGFRVLVAIFPEGYQVGSDEPDTTPQRQLLGVCSEVGLACIDLLPAFRAAGEDLFTDTQHPNARGLTLAADAIAAALSRSR